MNSKETVSLKQTTDLLHQLRFYQLRIRTVNTAYNMPVSLSELHIIHELATNPGQSISELSEHINLEQSGLSRAVQRMKKEEYIKIEVSDYDRRRKELTTAEKGLAILKRCDNINNDRADYFSSHLTAEELSLFVELYKRFVDGLGAREIKKRRIDRPIVLEHRRLTREIGALGRDFLGLKTTVPELQLLFEVNDPLRYSTPSRISETLGLSIKTVSTTLGRLEKEGLLEREKSKRDGRSLYYRLSVEGQACLGSIYDRSYQVFSAAFKGFNQKEVETLLNLYSKYLGVKRGESFVVTEEIAEPVRVSKPNELRRLRSRLIRSLVETDNDLNAPAIIFSKSSICYGVGEDEDSDFACEFHQDDSRWSLLNAFPLPGQKKKAAATEYLRRAIKDFAQKQKLSEIIVSSDSYLSLYAIMLGGVEEGGVITIPVQR